MRGFGCGCGVCGKEHVVKGERDTNVENTRQAITAGTAAASAGRHEKQLHESHFWNTIVVVVVASYPEFIPVRSASTTSKSYRFNDNVVAPEAPVFQSL